eukprot:5509616-Pleurochrysis_carterae.AAC.1
MQIGVRSGAARVACLRRFGALRRRQVPKWPCVAKANHNRRGGAVYPRTIVGLKVLRRCVRRGKP